MTETVWNGFKRIDFEFEGKKYSGYKNYDKRLAAEYGDYMKLPPENERTPHLEFSSCKF